MKCHKILRLLQMAWLRFNEGFLNPLVPYLEDLSTPCFSLKSTNFSYFVIHCFQHRKQTQVLCDSFGHAVSGVFFFFFFIWVIFVVQVLNTQLFSELDLHFGSRALLTHSHMRSSDSCSKSVSLFPSTSSCFAPHISLCFHLVAEFLNYSFGFLQLSC